MGGRGATPGELNAVAYRPDTGTLVAVAESGVAYRSTDDAITWTAITLPGAHRAVDHAGDGVWYAAGSALHISTDDGETWSLVPNAPAPGDAFVALAFRDAGTGLLLEEDGAAGAAWRTTDGGQTWSAVVDENEMYGPTDVTYAGDDTWYLTRTYQDDAPAVLRSRADGEAGTWDVLLLQPFGGTGPYAVDFATPDLGYVIDRDGMMRTDDGGESWTRTTYPSGHNQYGRPQALAVFDVNRILVVGTSGAITLTTSGGGSPAIVPLAGEQEPENVPVVFSLDAPYPNPFRGQATLAYTLGSASDVSLTVYDLLGRRIAQVVDERQTAGQHTAPFDGRELASGVYIVRLLVGEQTVTRRMTLMR